jgi:hypothetical protein
VKLLKRLFFVLIFLTFFCAFLPGIYGHEPPVVVADSIPVTDTLPQLRALLLAEPLQLAPKADSVGALKLPPVPRGFFCKFEDKMQQKWKIPLNLELK